MTNTTGNPAPRLLTAEDQLMVMKLSAILRIADGLDRTHGGKITDVRVKSIGKRIQLQIAAKKKKDLEIELWGAERKKELFEEVFRVTAVVSQPRKR